MSKLFAILFLLLSAICLQAQQTTPTNVNASSATNSAAPSASPLPASKEKAQNGSSNAFGKFSLPPEKLNPVRITRFSASPVIDGRVDDEIWKTAPVLKDFYQTSPGDNIPASKPTEVMLGYDEKYLYIAFKCYDERDQIRATVAKRDEVFGEDNVRVWLDTYNDQRRAYVLGFNPLGIQQDGIHTEGRGSDFSVDIVMESKGVIEEWGWSVEVKIPFKSLRYAAGKGKLWGFNAARNIDRLNDELDQWLPDDRNISGFLIKHGKITGLEDIKTERTLEVVPSVTLSETGRRTRTIPQFMLTPNSIDPGRFVNQPIKQDLGVTMKLGITPNVTLDFAYNPDFAEIEADAPVVSANQRFPIFFQEKRPFFLEGAEIFQSPLQVFYSRTIVDPDVAAKLTGKIGRTSFGFLAASDKAPGNYDEDDRNDPLIRPRIDEFLDKNASFAVVRIKRDIGKENNVGFFGTFRSFPEQRNLLGGFDGTFKLDPKTISTFQVIGTHSRRCFFNAFFEPTLNPGQTQRNRQICDGSTFNEYRTGNGFGYLWNLDYTEKNRGWFFEVTGRTKDYRADAGFTRRTNTNRVFFANRFSTEPRPKAGLIRVDWRQNAEISYDWQGRSQDINLGTNFNFTLQKNTYASVETGIYFERIFEEEFGLKRSAARAGAFAGEGERSEWQHYLSGNISRTFSKQLSAGLFLGTIGNAYDFDFGGGNRFPRVSPSFLTGTGQLDPGPGRQFDFSADVNYKPIDPLRLSVSYRKSRLTRNDTGLTAFDSNIFTFRSTYQFSRFTFARTRVDYDSLTSNFSGQFLLGWNPNPGTAVYAGYNDNFNYNGFSPFTDQLEPGIARNSRTFFIRASYLFRKSF